MIDLRPAIVRVAEVLDEEGIPYMVIGGVANLVWGQARTTTDLDLTVDVEAVGVEGFLEVARRVGLPIPDDPLDVAERGRLVPVRTDDGVRVDFVLATQPIELDAIARAARLEVAGTPVSVCTPEDLIVLKSVSQRARDHDDIVGVLRRQGGRLDLERLDSVIAGIAAGLGEPEIGARWEAAKRAASLR